MQPLGVRVLPEEYWMNATASRSGGEGSTLPRPASDSQECTEVSRLSSGGSAGSISPSRRKATGWSCSQIRTSWVAYSSGLIPRAGIGSEASVPPASHTPRRPRTASGVLVSTAATAVPGRTPARLSPAVICSASRTTSLHGEAS